MSKVNIDDNLINELMSLSKITLTSEERENTRLDFDRIIEYMNILGECDTSTFEETLNDSLNVEELRPDEENLNRITPEYTRSFTNKEISVPEVL